MWVPTVSVMSQVCELKQDPLDIFPKNNMAHTSPVSKRDIIYHTQNYEWIRAKEAKINCMAFARKLHKIASLEALAKRQINHCIQITPHQPWVGQLTFSPPHRVWLDVRLGLVSVSVAVPLTPNRGSLEAASGCKPQKAQREGWTLYYCLQLCLIYHNCSTNAAPS